MTQRLELTPERPGEVRVTHAFDVPDGVTSIETRVPEEATVTGAEGFSEGAEGSYSWDEETTSPTLTFTWSVNQTVDLVGPEGAGGDYIFVDAGQWALLRRPQVPVRWSWRGPDPVGFRRSATTDGSGYVGDTLAYLGTHDTHTRTAHGQELRLVVPDRADMAESPEAVLDALVEASDRMRVGDRDRTVHVIAAPTGELTWGVRGLQFGPSAMWVRDQESLDGPDNTWFHEYVHSRQGYTTDPSGRWLEEATATYYAALLALETDRAEFRAFREFLRRGTFAPQSRSVMAEPASWDNAANYWKGALLVGDLDRRIRLATDETRSFGAVFSRLNAREEPVDRSAFVESIRETAGSGTADTASTYTATPDVPQVWSSPAHTAAFGETPARFTYRFGSREGVDGAFAVSGPYRNESLDGPPLALYTGETLSADVSVLNAGGATADYEGIFDVGSTSNETVSGSLTPGEAATHTVEHTVESTGERTVSFGSESVTVRVYDPAQATVSNVTVTSRSLEAPGTVTVDVTVTNGHAVPARREVTVTRNAEPVANRTVSLGAGETRTVSIPVELTGTGEYQLGVANAGSATVTVGSEDASAGSTTEATGSAVTGDVDDAGPGFGVVSVLVSLAVLATLGRRRR